jgi:hypothetical protein
MIIEANSTASTACAVGLEKAGFLIDSAKEKRMEVSRSDPRRHPPEDRSESSRNHA